MGGMVMVVLVVVVVMVMAMVVVVLLAAVAAKGLWHQPSSCMCTLACLLQALVAACAARTLPKH